MEREPLSSETEALWHRLWEIWQENDEEDVILDATILRDLEEEIPDLEGRMKTALAYLQRARYISTAPASAKTAWSQSSSMSTNRGNG
jgi:hypothetical protein